MKRILTPKFFNRPTLKVAKKLLGKFLIRKVGRSLISGMITEVEAYIGPEDKASHASRLWRGSLRAARGKTKRTEVMFREAGYWYIYMIYGMYYCLNIVTEKEDYPAAILIRSTSKILGPGRVCRYFKIKKKFNSRLADKKTGLWIEDRGIKIKNRDIGRGKRISVDPSPFLGCASRVVIKRDKRIGVEYAGEYKNKLWRFYLACAK